jgi:hypothetical protein
VERDTRNARLRALLPLTKANQRLAHYNNLTRGHSTTTSANQKITSWSEDGKITFSSGISEEIDKDKAREFLEGKITSLRTSFGQITFDSQTIICGCHRVTMQSAREWLGLPAIESKEESFPDFLQAISDKMKEIESHRSEELEPFELTMNEATEAFQAFKDEQDKEEGKLYTISHAYSEHVKEGGKWEVERKDYCKFQTALNDANNALRELRSEINSDRYKMKQELQDKLTRANAKAREAILAKLEGSDDLREAIAKNTEAITTDHEKKAKEAKQAIDSQAALEALRSWLDFVALTSSQALIQTTSK